MAPSPKASQDATDQLKYYVGTCREILDGVRNRYAPPPNADDTVQAKVKCDREVAVRLARKEIASYTLKIMNQFLFVDEISYCPTITHHNRLACLVTELSSTLRRYEDSQPNKGTIKELRDMLEDWSYKFDRYWFLFAIYVDSPTTLIQRLPDHTLNDRPPTLPGPLHGCNATRNSSLQHLYDQTRGTHVIVDGHGLVVNHVYSLLSDALPEEMALSNRLRNAAAVSSSLMNAVAVLPVHLQTPTPLVFETKMEVENCDTLRTSLWEQKVVVPEENAKIARSLAEAVHGLHVCNVQHGSIMPDCVLVASTTKVLLHGFLCDPSDDWGWKTSDGTRSFDGYYHVAPRGQRTMKDDIRNLGICLLELGSTNSLLKKEGECPQPGELWTVDPAKSSIPSPPKKSRQVLLGLADSHLDDVGHRFSAVVRACLTVSDLRLKEKTNDERVDLSIWFIDKVLLELRKVNVHYEEVPPESP